MKTADIIATAAAAFALLSLFATLWFAFITRRHNRLSVRPYLDIYIETSPTKPVAFKLINAGIGPAIVKHCVYIFGDERNLVSDLTFPKRIADELLRLQVFVDYKAIAPGSYISPGEEIFIVSFGYPEGNPAAHARQRDFIERFGVEIHYESMYGEKFIRNLPPRIAASTQK